jgi:hypothetical protein
MPGAAHRLAPPGMRVRLEGETRYNFEKDGGTAPSREAECDNLVAAPHGGTTCAGTKGSRGAVRGDADLRVSLTGGAGTWRRVQLPLRFERLMQQMVCLETALSFVKTRRATEVCSFDVLKNNVENIDGRAFPLDTLRQVRCTRDACAR